MASGSFNVTTSNQYISGKVDWSSTPDNANNKSTVTATLRLSRTNTNYETISSGSFTINIGGNPKTNNGSFTFTYNSNTLCVTHTAIIDHNSDGSKSIAIAVSCDMSRFEMAVQSGMAVLDNIPRESTISTFPNFTIGNSFTVSVSRASTGFTHTLMLYVGATKIGEWTGVGTSTTITFTAAQLTALYGAIATSATVTLRCYTYNGSTSIGDYTTKTATATVANASTITTFGNFTIGDSIAVAISRDLSDFTHTIMFYVGSTKVCERTGIATSTTLTLSTAEQNTLYSAFKDAASGAVTLRCYTYHGTNPVRSYTSKSATASVSSSIVPTFTSITAEETVSAVSALGVYIRNLSRVKFTINGAAGASYSTITAYKIVFNGVTYNSHTVTMGAINTSGTLIATATITDSRGRTATKTVSITLVDYDNPKITSLSVVRCNADGALNPLGTYIKVSIRGSVSSISSKNTMRYLIKTAPRGTTTWTTKKDASPAIPTLSVDDVVGTYAITASFDIRVELIDKFNTSISTTPISTGEVTMSWAKKGIGAGKIWEQGSLDVAEDVYIAGNGKTIGGSNFDNGWLKLGTPTRGMTIDENELYVFGTNLILGSAVDDVYIRSGSTDIAVFRSNMNIDVYGLLTAPYIVTAQSRYWFDTPTGLYGLDLKNSDIVGLNNLVFNDDCNSDMEGIQFPKPGKGQSKIVADYDTLRGYNGDLLFNSYKVWYDGNLPQFRNIPVDTNLNNLSNNGTYIQYTSANARTIYNYPAAIAGVLTTKGFGNSNMIFQSYHAYDNSGYWVRSYYNGSWYAWKRVTLT